MSEGPSEQGTQSALLHEATSLASAAVDAYRAEDLARSAALFLAALDVIRSGAPFALKRAEIHEKLAIVRLVQSREMDAIEACRESLAALAAAPASAERDHLRGRASLSLGNAFLRLAQYPEALAAYQEASTSFAGSPISTDADRARAQINAGLAARNSGGFGKAVELLRRGLDLVPKDDPEGLRPLALRFLANAFQDRGELAAARAVFEELLDTGRNDPVFRAETYAGFAALNTREGRLGEASVNYGRAVECVALVPRDERKRLAVLVASAAAFAAHFGLVEEAHRLIARAERLATKPRKVEFIVAAATAGAALRTRSSEFPEAAKVIVRAARRVAQLAGADTPDVASLMAEASTLFRQAGKPDNARKLLRTVPERTGDPRFVQVDIARAELAIDRDDRAIAHGLFRRTLSTELGRNRTENLARILGGLAQLALASGRQSAAAFYGKCALEPIEASTETLGTAAIRDFHRSRREHLYSALMGSLLTASRLAEAEHIHDLLRRDQLSTTLGRDVRFDSVLKRPIYRPEEQPLFERLERCQADLTTLRTTQTLSLIRADQAAPDQRQIDEALARVEDWIADVESEVWARPEVPKPPPRPQRLESVGSVSCCFLRDGQSVRALVSRDGVQTVVEISAKASALSDLIFQLRARSDSSLEDLADLLEPLSALLIEPISEWIDGASAFIIDADTPLDGVPFCALLHRGRCVVGCLPVVFRPATSLIERSERPRRAWRFAAFGASRFEAGQALPNVRIEVEALARLYRSEPKVDDDFTSEALRDAFSAGVEHIHIASHFDAVPARPELSPLHLGDGSQLTLAEFRSDLYPCDNLELLVLSACATASGDFGADGLEGFAAVAMAKGARRVLGSLWSVPDQASARLMQAFYRHAFKNDTTIDLAEALRRAQLDMIAASRETSASLRKLGIAGSSAKPNSVPLRAWAGWALFDAGA